MHRGKLQTSICQKAHLSNKFQHNSSNLTLVRVVSMCFGPFAATVMKGKLEKQKYILSKYEKERSTYRKKVIEIATYLILV